MSAVRNFSGIKLPSLLSQKKKDTENSPLMVIRDQSIENYFSSFPTEEQLKQSFRDAFVINRPMDQVGGDGYWICETDDFVILVVFDCVGHGRRASIMTRFYLRVIYDEVVNNEKSDPGNILMGVHQQVTSEFGRKTENLQSGADMGILTFDKAHRKISYSGACLDLVSVKDKEINRIKGGKRPVGDLFEVERTYTTISFPVAAKDESTYYLFSDGAIDLMGGERNKRLGYKGFAEILKQHSELEFGEQKAQLVRDFNYWLGAHDQLDDLLVIGVKI